MAVVSVNVPDAIVPQVLASLRRRYPDMVALTDAAAGREGVARILRETLQAAEADRVERGLRAQLEQARADQLAVISVHLAQIK